MQPPGRSKPVMLFAPTASSLHRCHPMRRTLHLGRIAGVAIGLDWTVALISILIASSLAMGLFPSWHPDWSPGLCWATAIAATILFFASVVAHELAHALVAVRYGVPVRSITLFLFGGVTNLDREPISPSSEAVMAVVGPLTSLIIGMAALVLAGLFVDREAVASGDAAMIYGSLSPAGTLLAWLGPLNIFLAVFNMLPGFPLDGGRILRAALWALGRDLRKATRWAAYCGVAIGWLLAIAGIFMTFGFGWRYLGNGVGQGLWLALIGWFLSSAAVSSYRRTIVQSLLEDVPVDRLMHAASPVVSADSTIHDLVSNVFLGSDRSSVPVQRVGASIGIVSVDNVRAVPRDEWDLRRISDVMTPIGTLPQARPEQDAYEALENLERTPQGYLPVIEDGRVLGIIDRQDIGRWLTLSSPQA
jgi:Zn-dependent protease/CBS domain-containing protein